MKVLALETSTSTASVAFAANGEVVFLREFPSNRARGGAFFSALAECLRICGHPDRVAVGIGPGSYNGIRMALAAATGLQLSRGIDIAPCLSPKCVEAPAEDFWFVGDARGGMYHTTRITHGEIAAPPRLLSPAQAAQEFQKDGIPVFGAEILKGIPGMSLAHPSARRLALIADHLETSPVPPEPLYLKPPHITQPSKGKFPLENPLPSA